MVKTGNIVHNTDKKCSLFFITWRKDSRFLGYCPMFGSATHKCTQRCIGKPPYSYRDIKMLNAPWFWASTWTPLILLVHFPAKPEKYFLSETSNQPPNQLVTGLFNWCAPSSCNEGVGYTSTSSYTCKTCTETILLLYSSTLFNNFRK